MNIMQLSTLTSIVVPYKDGMKSHKDGKEDIPIVNSMRALDAVVHANVSFKNPKTGKDQKCTLGQLINQNRDLFSSLKFNKKKLMFKIHGKMHYTKNPGKYIGNIFSTGKISFSIYGDEEEDLNYDAKLAEFMYQRDGLHIANSIAAIITVIDPDNVGFLTDNDIAFILKNNAIKGATRTNSVLNFNSNNNGKDVTIHKNKDNDFGNDNFL